MAKRFIDTELFNDPWFMDLSKDAKILWIYAITNCDHAGILKVNEKLIQFQTKIKSYLSVSKELGNCLIRLNESEYYFIPKFFKFQYPNYPEKSFRAVESAILTLQKFNLWDEKTNSPLTVSKDLPKSYGIGNGISKGNGIVKKELPFNSDIFKNTWNRWEKYRREIKHKLTPSTIEGQLKKLSSYSEDEAIKIIDQSITNGWTGLFELKDNKTKGNPLR